MLDIRFIRENPQAVKENIKKKYQDTKLPLVDEVIDLDAPSWRKVVTSTGPPAVRTVTVPWRSPVGMAREPKRAMVSSGIALVATSQSSGVRPRRLSRTQPPTHQASWPACCD